MAKIYISGSNQNIFRHLQMTRARQMRVYMRDLADANTSTYLWVESNMGYGNKYLNQLNTSFRCLRIFP